MVSYLVKVISIISLQILCNSFSSVHSGAGLEINGQHSVALNITTLSSMSKEVKDIEPIIPPGPDVNPTVSPSPTTNQLPSTTTSSTLSTTGSSTPSVPSSPTPPTAAPGPVNPPSPTPSPPSGGNDRHFDGPSFVGGIVLATGLTCIGFVGFKVYRARTERNYHTL